MGRFKKGRFLGLFMGEEGKEYGSFEVIKDDSEEVVEEEQDEQGFRLKKPGKGEFIGIVLQRLGGNRMEVKSTDGKTRNARVPGRFKRRFWLRPKDPVIIKPWDDDDGKADIIFQYKGGQKTQLEKSGILNDIKDEF